MRNRKSQAVPLGTCGKSQGSCRTDCRIAYLKKNVSSIKLMEVFIQNKEVLFMNFRFTKTAILAMGFALASNANAAIYDFSETIQGVNITGSFTGTANGNDITGISNISVNVGGIAFTGPLTAESLNSGTLVQGNADVTFNGLGNNFMFIDRTDPSNVYNNYLASTPAFTTTNDIQYAAANTAFSINPSISLGVQGGPTNWSVTAVPVPSAVWLFGSALAGLIGFNRHKPA
jgi:hypothetical protein